MAGLREAQKLSTRQLVLSTGLELFGAGGYSATTVDDIAQRAGMTRATFYLHFGSKMELMQELVRAAHEILNTPDDPRLDEVVVTGDPAAIHDWLGRKLARWPERRPELGLIQQAETEPEIVAIVDEMHDATISRMVAGLDRAGRFDTESRRVRCVLAFGTLEAASRRWMRLGWDAMPKEILLQQLAESWAHLLTEANAERGRGSAL